MKYNPSTTKIIAALLFSAVQLNDAFNFPSIPAFAKLVGGGNKAEQQGIAKISSSPLLESQKKELLETISFTKNGKDASPQTQARVLSLVREIEQTYPPSENLLSDPKEIQKLDGVWYLQYTSPSDIEEISADEDAWKPKEAAEGEINIDTKRYEAKGSIQAAGIPVDTSGNRVTTQSFDIAQGILINESKQDFGTVTITGTYRQSDNVPNRAVVTFLTADIALNIGITLKLGFLLAIRAFLKGTGEVGWLETTYIGEDMRIGRGNKGTLFILTKDADAVKP
eukprot:CAMPEP_0185735352 /NCGR_PEP_ID=MMETSP1171-20130828/25038_1 /TAXON_ID=374046 /ORGANISM="Helicotheca tamensis, Strain CCMP826" /LENGTH=281 /DNA_ID=CAMNT_0028405623 /DNA_START=20 /DNA_END=865 /DNA_ORIENTATION=+